jgi:hypothetical protein
LPSNILDDIQPEINAVRNECFRQILSSSNFLKFENAPYFVTASSVSLAQLAETLGVSEELGKMFLIDNAHLVEVEFEISDSNAPMNFRVPKYSITTGLSNFLESASRGGVFHIEFRKKFIRLSQQALAFLNTPHLLLLSGVNM